MTFNTAFKTGMKRYCLFLSLILIGFFQESKAEEVNNWLTINLVIDKTVDQHEPLIFHMHMNDEWQINRMQIPSTQNLSTVTAELDLGQNAQIDILKVVWPTNEQQILSSVKANQVLDLDKPKFPLPPSNVFARVINTNQIDLVWKDNSDNEIGFSIERSKFSDRGFKEIGRVEKDQNFYSDKSVLENQTYFYRIRAISKDGYSLFDGAYQKTEENTGLVLEDVNQPLRMYPNPNSDFLDVRVNNDLMGDVMVKFLDNDGKELKSLKINKKIKDLKTKVDISSLPFGIYMIEISLVTYKSLFKAI